MSNICRENSATYYTDGGVRVGIVIYTDEAMTVPLTGATLFQDDTSHRIFTIDSDTGEILSKTSGICGGGIAGTYQVGNDDSLICAADATTLYTVNNGFDIGDIIYSDINLITPLTGYDLIVNAGGIIYDLDSDTGEVLTIHGKCFTSAIGTFQISNDLSTICDNAYAYLYRQDNKFLKQGDILYTDQYLTVPVTGYDYVTDVATQKIFLLDTHTGEVGKRVGLSCPQKT